MLGSSLRVLKSKDKLSSVNCCKRDVRKGKAGQHSSIRAAFS